MPIPMSMPLPMPTPMNRRGFATRAPRGLSVVVLAALVAGCATTSPVAESPADRKARAWLADIRAEARRLPSNVHVMPLEEPAVADLRARAEADDAAGRYRAAADAWQRAIALSPEDPTLWQGLAEARVGSAEWATAEEAARRAIELGPGVGELCLRSWLTVHAARIEQRDAVGAAEAMHRVSGCQAAPPPRF
jgi:tetratricopeptide (TPR) repeat protein